MKLVDLAIIAVIVLVLFFAVRFLLVKRKKGETTCGCSGGSGACSHCCSTCKKGSSCAEYQKRKG